MQTIRQATTEIINEYYASLCGQKPLQGLYYECVTQLEKPLITATLRYVRGNQVRAAKILGINRNTLRKKIKELQVDVKAISREYDF